MDEKNVYSGKTVEEAIQIGLATLGATEEQVEITVLDEGKKKLIGGVKARVKVVKKVSDGARAVEFIDGLLEILKLNAVCELVSDDEKVEINITSTESNHIIGRHGEVLDSLQNLAGAVANIGREDYKRVVVDCENYREGREKTLKELAERLAKKAVERQRRVTLE
ncbi:MAG: Jag N-terminal domain-containing protein, partial [Clostridia bacterium]|nr:Jag N-terminal domain-containing protein [Clostridia bacterium]